MNRYNAYVNPVVMLNMFVFITSVADPDPIFFGPSDLNY